MQVFVFHKIIGICRILMSEAWYTMNILANRILCHGCVTIATKMLSFLFTVNSERELSVYRKPREKEDAGASRSSRNELPSLLNRQICRQQNSPDSGLFFICEELYCFPKKMK